MFSGLLTTLFVILCFILVLLILIQKGKSSSGFGGGFGGGAQALFGGSGGQDIFQKITWVLGALFMIGSLGLAILKTKEASKARYLNKVGMTQAPIMPVAESDSSADNQ